MSNKTEIRRRLCHSSFGYQPTALWGLYKEKDETYWMDTIRVSSSSYLDRALQKVFGYKAYNPISKSMIKVFLDIRYLWERGYSRKTSIWRELLTIEGTKETLEALKGRLEIYKLGEKMKG